MSARECPCSRRGFIVVHSLCTPRNIVNIIRPTTAVSTRVRRRRRQCRRRRRGLGSAGVRAVLPALYRHFTGGCRRFTVVALPLAGRIQSRLSLEQTPFRRGCSRSIKPMIAGFHCCLINKLSGCESGNDKLSHGGDKLSCGRLVDGRRVITPL